LGLCKKHHLNSAIGECKRSLREDGKARELSRREMRGVRGTLGAEGGWR
jgi:hypothetical protein